MKLEILENMAKDTCEVIEALNHWFYCHEPENIEMIETGNPIARFSFSIDCPALQKYAGLLAHWLVNNGIEFDFSTELWYEIDIYTSDANFSIIMERN